VQGEQPIADAKMNQTANLPDQHAHGDRRHQEEDDWLELLEEGLGQVERLDDYRPEDQSNRKRHRKQDFVPEPHHESSQDSELEGEGGITKTKDGGEEGVKDLVGYGPDGVLGGKEDDEPAGEFLDGSQEGQFSWVSGDFMARRIMMIGLVDD